VLQGSVLAQVNAGPLAICETFLGHAPKYPVNHIAKLRETVDAFLDICGKAIELNGALIQQDQMEFQFKLEQGYQNLKGQISRKYGARSSNAALHYSALMSQSVRNLLVEAKGNQRRKRLGITQVQEDTDDDDSVIEDIDKPKSGSNSPTEIKEVNPHPVSGESSPITPMEPQIPLVQSEPTSSKSEAKSPKQIRAIESPKSPEIVALKSESTPKPSPEGQKIRSFAMKKNETTRYEPKSLKDSDERKRTGSNPIVPVLKLSDADKKPKK